MSLFKKAQPVTATINDKPFTCLVCGSTGFWDREVKLNSTGAELLNAGWANQSVTGLICASCGYVHEFASDALQLWKT